MADVSVGREPEQRIFRRASWKWLLAGATCVLGASFYMGTSLPDLVREVAGHRASLAIWYALALAGALDLLVGALLFGEHVTIDEVAIEQFRWGRPRLRMLWTNLERVTLFKSPKRLRGPVELWGAGRSLKLDPGYTRFGELEAAIVQRATQVGAEMKDLREPAGG